MIKTFHEAFQFVLEQKVCTVFGSKSSPYPSLWNTTGLSEKKPKAGGWNPKVVARGEIVADRWGLVTMEKINVSKTKNRIRLGRRQSVVTRLIESNLSEPEEPTTTRPWAATELSSSKFVSPSHSNFQTWNC